MSDHLYPVALERLIDEFARLPGVGRRTAQRLAFHVLSAPEGDAAALADALLDVKRRIGFCEICFNLAEGPQCTVCMDVRRQGDLICVVENPGDIFPIERTHEYPGRYHVLGGALSPVDGVEPSDLRIDELLARVQAGEVREVILATNQTTSGEATALYLADALRMVQSEISVTRPASGLPVGSDIELADEVTLSRAMAGRNQI